MRRQQGRIDFVTMVIALIFLVATLSIIYNHKASSFQLKEDVLSVSRDINARTVIPELILNSDCSSLGGGLYSLQKLKENDCGLGCLNLQRKVQVEIESPVLDLTCPSGKIDWSYQRSYPIVILNQSSGRRYSGYLFVRN